MDGDIRRQQKEGEADQLPRFVLSGLIVWPILLSRKSPNQDTASEKFDDTVRPKGNEDHTPSFCARPERDPSFGEVPHQTDRHQDQSRSAERIGLRHQVGLLVGFAWHPILDNAKRPASRQSRATGRARCGPRLRQSGAGSNVCGNRKDQCCTMPEQTDHGGCESKHLCADTGWPWI